MSNGLEVNKLITETIYELSPDQHVSKLLRELLRYELDIWNRYPRKSEILNQYELMVEKATREMKE